MANSTKRLPSQKEHEAELEMKRLAKLVEGKGGAYLKKRKQKAKGTLPLEFQVTTVAIPLEALEPHPLQPRHRLTEKEVKELAESINLHGLATPLLVMRKPEDSEKYYLLDGVRRRQAVQMLKSKEVKCNVIDQDLRNDQALALMLTMDATRESFNPIELGRAFRVLRQELQLTQQGLANLLRIQQSKISRCERLEDALHEEIVAACLGSEAHWVKHNHLRQLVRLIEIPDIQLDFFKRLCKEKCSIRRLKQEVDKVLNVVCLPSQHRNLTVEDDTFKVTIIRKAHGGIDDQTVKGYVAMLNLKMFEVYGIELNDLAEWYGRMADYSQTQYKERVKQNRQRMESSPDYDPDASI